MPWSYPTVHAGSLPLPRGFGNLITSEEETAKLIMSSIGYGTEDINKIPPANLVTITNTIQQLATNKILVQKLNQKVKNLTGATDPIKMEKFKAANKQLKSAKETNKGLKDTLSSYFAFYKVDPTKAIKNSAASLSVSQAREAEAFAKEVIKKYITQDIIPEIPYQEYPAMTAELPSWTWIALLGAGAWFLLRGKKVSGRRK